MEIHRLFAGSIVELEPIIDLRYPLLMHLDLINDDELLGLCDELAVAQALQPPADNLWFRIVFASHWQDSGFFGSGSVQVD